MEREGGKEEGTGALGGESGQRGRKGRRKQEEENRRVIQGRRYSLPGMAARRQESCCVRSLCQIGEKGRERKGRRERERESAQQSCWVRLPSVIRLPSRM